MFTRGYHQPGYFLRAQHGSAPTWTLGLRAPPLGRTRRDPAAAGTRSDCSTSPEVQRLNNEKNQVTRGLENRYIVGILSGIYI